METIPKTIFTPFSFRKNATDFVVVKGFLEKFQFVGETNWIYEKTKKVIGAKNGDISRNLRFSLIFAVGSISTATTTK